MSFTVYQKPAYPNSGRPTNPRVMMRRSVNTGTSICLNEKLLAELRWIAGDRVEVLVGNGDDAGIVALRRGRSGYKLTMDGGAKRLRISAKGLLPGEPVRTTECNFSVKDDVLYIAMPDSIFAPRPAVRSVVVNSHNATVAA